MYLMVAELITVSIISVRFDYFQTRQNERFPKNYFNAFYGSSHKNSKGISFGIIVL